MKVAMRLVLISAFLFLGLNAGIAWCADAAAPEESAPAATEEMSLQADIQWVWAEVVSVDPATDEMRLKYLDYETDTEKEMVMTANNQTAYENVKALVEIKPTDTVSIDYIIAADGKNLAKNVNVEKAEGIMPAQEEAVTIPREEEKAPEAQPATAPPAALPAETGQTNSGSATQGY